jgi:hypothetical protein
MSDIFSLKDMLNFFVEGEDEDEPSPKEQIIFEGIEEVKKLLVLQI